MAGTRKPVSGACLVWSVLLTGIAVCLAACAPAEAKEDARGTYAPSEEKETARGAERKTETAIRYQIVYNMEITSADMAAAAIREEGQRQRKTYDNPPVEEIELQMEEEFGILAVNLGEMSEGTAQYVYDAFAYMYDRYPQLYGSLTNLTLGNMGNKTGGTMAFSERTELVVNGDYGAYPFVEKHQIVLNARWFLDDERLERTCERQVESGYWTKGADPSSIIVHELGHQLQNVIVQKRFGLTCAYYVTEENGDAFDEYQRDRLKNSGNVTEEMLRAAYEKWQQDYGNEGTYEAFVAQISQYALKDEKKNDYQPSETFAEAFADLYRNGENACDAAKAIEDIAKEYLEQK